MTLDDLDDYEREEEAAAEALGRPIEERVNALLIMPHGEAFAECSYCRGPILPTDEYDRSPLGPITHLRCLPTITLQEALWISAAPLFAEAYQRGAI